MLERGALGEVRQIDFVRTVAPRQRSWTDDALLHHAAHPLHLLLHWFPAVRLLGCAAHPNPVGAQHVAVLAALENGAPVTVSVSYHTRVPAAHLLLVGERHTVSSDGFERIESDLIAQNWRGDAETVYHSAIHAQDLEFLRACRGEDAGVPWSETIRLAAAIDQLRQFGSRNQAPLALR
jgi:predicted dehydrogenase